MRKGKSETRYTCRMQKDRRAHAGTGGRERGPKRGCIHMRAATMTMNESVRVMKMGPAATTAWQSELDLAAVTPDSEHVLVEDGPELALSGLGIWDAGRRSLGEEEWRRGVRACLVRRWHYCGWLGSMIVVGGEIIETNVEANGAHADRRAVVSLRDAEAQRVLGMRLCSARVIVIWSRRAAECSSSRSPSRRTVHRIAG